MIEQRSFIKSQPFFLRFAFALGLILFSALSSAETKHYRFAGFNDDQLGLGVFLGDPLSLQLRYFTNWKRAFSFSTGYSSSKTAQLSVDYLYYGYNAQDKVIDRDFWNSLIFYGGAGALSGVGLAGSDPSDNFQFALRLVGGLEYIFVGSPWSTRFEAAPELFLKGKNPVGLELGLGLTYYWWDGGAKKTGETQIHETRTQKHFVPPTAKPKSDTQSGESGDEFDEFK